MNCPHCGGETTVRDSRPAPNNTFRRRRKCIACQRRVTTYESTVNPQTLLKFRASESARQKRWREADPQRHERLKAYNRLYQQVRREAAATGETHDQVRARWGVT